ncbi:MAG: hypothetical protein IPI64_08340 [Chloracidobacterium sp.]|nr:hypothetical protein [Chloracidobacterium sp.]
MNDRLRRDHESCARSNQFLTDNLVDFNTGIVKTKRQALEAAVNDTESKDAVYSGGFGESSMEFEQKETSRSVLRADVASIADMAEGMEPDFDGISDLFRFKRNLSDVALLALARAFHTASADFEADFIAYGLSATFRADLNTHADEFEAATNAASAAKGDRVGAGAALAAAVKLEMQLKRTMDPIVRTKYAGNIAKLTAWASAFHVEKAPKKKDPPTPPPPTP